MSFAEKTAWVMGAIMIIAGGAYLNTVAKASAALGEVGPPVIGFLIGYVIVVAIASIVAMTFLGISSPEEANALADEREKVAIDKAGHWSGYVLAIGVVSGLLHYGFHNNGNMLFHICFVSLMLCQIAEYGFQIWFLRRGV